MASSPPSERTSFDEGDLPLPVPERLPGDDRYDRGRHIAEEPKSRRGLIGAAIGAGVLAAAGLIPGVRDKFGDLLGGGDGKDKANDLPVPVTDSSNKGSVPNNFTDRDSSYAMAGKITTPKIGEEAKDGSAAGKSTNATAAAKRAKPTVPTPLSDDSVAHLLARFTFGATAADIADVKKRGLDGWIEHQLDGGKVTYDTVPEVGNTFTLLKLSGPQVHSTLKGMGKEFGWPMMDELARATLGMQLWNPWQLHERMVDFWANHLSVANHRGDQWHVRHLFDRDVIRKHALGTFSDMLLDASKNPSMLLYLNQDQSRKQSVNENYAREIMELHTLGYGGGYDENDVRNAAYILTGRTVTREGEYKYEPKMHWTGQVTSVGFSHPNGDANQGEAVGDAFVRHLATHPSTAKFIARKLCVRFVADVPPQPLVDRLAKSYIDNKTAIVPVLKELFSSVEFWASRGQKTRRPGENMVATARVLGVRPGDNVRDGLGGLFWMLTTMGNAPLEWQPPNGYPDVQGAWQSTATQARVWEMHRALVQGWHKGLTYTKPEQLLASTPGTVGQLVDALAQRLLHQNLRAEDRKTLLKFLGANGESAKVPNPTVNGKLTHLVPLYLDSIYHSLR